MAEFVPENELEELFLAGFSDPSKRPAFYSAFLEGAIIIIVANPSAPPGVASGSAVLPEQTELGIRMLTIEGVTHLPVFTSMARVAAYGPKESQCSMIRTRALLSAVPGVPILVNYGSTRFMGLNRAEIAALLNGTLLRSNAPDHQRIAASGMMLEPLRDPPFKMMARMVQLFRIRQAVRAAFIVSMHDTTKDEQAHPLVGIKAAGNWDALVRELTEIIDTHARPGEVVDMTPLDDKPFSARLRKEGRMFFQR